MPGKSGRWKQSFNGFSTYSIGFFMITKLKFFFAALVLIPSAYACKVDLRGVQLVEKEPYLAKTAVTGTVLIGKDGEATLKVNKYWGKHLSSYKLNYLLSECSVHVVPSFEYLFLSLSEIKENAMIGKSGGTFIKLSESKEYMEKLSSLTNFSGEINPAWQFCEKDDECVTSKNKCNIKIGVNRKYESTYLDFLKESNRKWDCSKKNEKQIAGKCINSFCE
jgi:hypothetical protein